MKDNLKPLLIIKKLKIRYIIVFFVILVPIILTPWFIELAHIERGYKAYGGEYLIILLGLCLAGSVLLLANDLDVIKNQRKEEKE